MFKDRHSYPNANSIADSKILSWKEQKYMLCINIILYIENFLKTTENYDDFLEIKWKLYWFYGGRNWIKFK